MGQILNISEAAQRLDSVYGPYMGGYLGNLGPNAFLLKLSGREPPGNAVNLNIAASAGDKGSIKEPLDPFEGRGRAFGRELSDYLDVSSREAVVTTGGCPKFGDWTTQEIAENHSDAFLVAMYPRADNGHLDPTRLPNFLKQYDWVVYTDMNDRLRSILVGDLNGILFCMHGGFGTSIEASAAADASKIIAFYDVGSEYGVTVAGLPFFKQISYKDTGASFLRSSNPAKLIERAFVELEVKYRGLTEELTALVAYAHTSKTGSEDVLVNLRATRLPVTFAHNGKRIKPIRHVLIHEKPDRVMEGFRSLFREDQPTVLPLRPIETPEFLALPIDYGIERADEVVRRLTERFGDQIIWDKAS